jgi:hypothetical protein
MNFSLVYWLALSSSPLSKFYCCLRHRGTNLSDDADISMKFWSSATSAPSVSLFPNDADSAKTYLAVTQTSIKQPLSTNILANMDISAKSFFPLSSGA